MQRIGDQHALYYYHMAGSFFHHPSYSNGTVFIALRKIAGTWHSDNHMQRLWALGMANALDCHVYFW
jgi:hypothetical protein